MTTEIRSLEEMDRAAEAFVKMLAPREAGATVIGLSGDLGSGKTTFTQAAARALGITEAVTSPTFVIEKIYKLKNQPFEHLIHIDAYRLEQSAELERLGWWELMEDPKNLIMIEWSEKVQDILPAGTRGLKFKFIDEKTREIEVQ